MTAAIVFNLCSLILFGAVLYFAYQAMRREFEARLRVVVRQSRRTSRKLTTENRALKAYLERIESRLKKQGDMPRGDFSTWKKMEDRAEEQISQVVSVNDVPVEVSN